jgi:general secretion pathway protein G
MIKRYSSQRGFTLIEMLIVMVVIGILAGILLTNMQGARQRARDGARKIDMREIKTALRLYYNDFQAYPANDGQGNILGCGNGTAACTWGGGAFTANGTQYMSYIPKDPINLGSQKYTYTQTNAGDGFELMTVLENKADTDSTNSIIRCRGSVTNEPLGTYIICAD